MEKTFYVPSDFVSKFDSILSRGLCTGKGRRDGQMCIEAAICAALNLPHGDKPECVAMSVRAFKIRLNDSNWSSPQARAKGLRDVGIAQLGSKGVVNDKQFARRVSELVIRELIPTLFRERFPLNAKCLAAADRCEKEGSREAALEARKQADAAAYAADKYLLIAANICLRVLKELKSPGCSFL